MSTRKTVLALEAVFDKANIIQEGPIDVAPEDNQRNEPEPDVMVLRIPYGEIARNPRPFEIALVVEIADSSLSQDLTTKARLYARASIQEYWVVDLKNRRLHVFRDPSKDGYERRFEAGETDSVAPLERPEHMIAVATLLG